MHPVLCALCLTCAGTLEGFLAHFSGIENYVPFVISFVLRFILYHWMVVSYVGAIMCLYPIPALFGKKKNGTFSWRSYIVFWPYIWGYQVVLGWRRYLSKEEISNHIVNGLYVSGWLNSKHLIKDPSQKVTVIDMTIELPKLLNFDYYLAVPCYDTTLAPLHEIHDALELAVDRHIAGDHVYVCCAAGHGRSASFMALLLTVCGYANNWRDAQVLMQKYRKKVKINSVQGRQLDIYLMSEHGKKLQSIAKIKMQTVDQK